MFCHRLIPVFLFLSLILSITGCQADPSPTISPSLTPSLTIQNATATLAPSLTPASTNPPTATSAPQTEPVTEICSPLAGIELDKLHSITSQGFTPPAAFQDDGHPAVDLAFFTFEDLPSMLGHPVQSILPGKVVLVIEDRFPYGSMILIETPLDGLTETLLPLSFIPTPIPDENILLFNPCAKEPLYAGLDAIEMSLENRSLYVLYSHLLEKPPFEPGDQVSCGETIGAVGLTGNTVAEHLHLEIRIGPSDARFNTFAMYQPDATVEERHSYCTWSSSGRFQPIDPSLFWSQQ